jgi:DNA invertase Pin-like site-specific DNA recombinase
MAMKLDSYIRVSKVAGREGDSYQTVDEQRRIIRETAKRLGVTVGVEVVEEDVSGHTRAADRRLGKLIERAESGESGGIIVAFQDRLSRGSMLDQAETWERLKKCGARFVSGDGVDSHQPGQQLLYDIRAAIARDQWERYRANWQSATRNALERGVHTGRCPIGYVRGDAGLLPDPETAEIVRQAFALRADGKSYSEVSRYFAEQGKPMTRQAIPPLLRNKTYLGEARGAFGMVNPAAHEPLVSRTIFERAQAAKTTSPRVTRNGNCTGKLIAQGIARCASCGCTLQTSSYRAPKKGQRLRYSCVNSLCTARASILGPDLDGYLERQILSKLSLAGRTIWNDAPKTDLGVAKAKIAEAEQARDAWIENAEAIALMGKDKWNSTLAKFTARVDAAAARLAEQAESEDIEPSWTRLYERWHDSDIAGRRDLVARVVESITVKPIYGKRGVPVEDRVVVMFKSRKARVVKIGLGRAGAGTVQPSSRQA